MKASVTLENVNDYVVYTVPGGTKALLFVELYSLSEDLFDPYVVVKINDLVYVDGYLDGRESFKLTLDGGDTIKVSVSGRKVNVFIHGILY